MSISVPKSFSPRLHVLLARQAPVGLVIRRGPSRHVCFVGWDRTTDRFELGQWLKGRIYAMRCDISPDGQHLIYFATKGGEAFTALSRTPFMKALGFWPQSDHWNGGGAFIDNKDYFVCLGFDPGECTEPASLTRVNANDGCTMGECPMRYFPRLQRDGWVRVEQRKSRGDSITIFMKQTDTGWTLRKLFHASSHSPKGRGCYWEEHELENFDGVRQFPDWEWADIDGKRFVWAERGKLCAAPTTARGIDEPTELFDFSTLCFTRTRAPY